MKTFKLLIAVVCLFAVVKNCKAQTQYPKAILPGQKQNIAAGTDTLWILNNTQFDNALINAKKIKIIDQELDVQKQIIQNRDSVISAQQGKIDILDTSYTHYKSLWSQCDSSLQKTEIQVVKIKKSRKIVAIVAAVTGALIVFVLKSL